jgi:hypothetical protein
MRMSRLGLVPVSSADPAVRRYRLARLEEVSLATPPNRNGNGHKPGAEVRSITPRAGIRDRRVS